MLTQEGFQQLLANQQRAAKPLTDRVEPKVKAHKPKRSKYGTGAKEDRTVDGIAFSSKREAVFYRQLKCLEKSGRVTGVELQPRFELQPTFKKLGVTYRSVVYVADFSYWESTTGVNLRHIIDVKGFRTPVYAIKRKWFERVYPNLTIEEL